MNTIEAVLDASRFLRIHRSHIVNVRRIAQLWSIAHGQFVIELTSGQRLQSGRTYGERIRRALRTRSDSISDLRLVRCFTNNRSLGYPRAHECCHL
jgi:Response regulator of the LytR/AlgR family